MSDGILTTPLLRPPLPYLNAFNFELKVVITPMTLKQVHPGIYQLKDKTGPPCLSTLVDAIAVEASVKPKVDVAKVCVELEFKDGQIKAFALFVQENEYKQLFIDFFIIFLNDFSKLEFGWIIGQSL